MQLKPEMQHTVPNVGVLGPFGTYSHEAAYNYFGDNVHYEELKTIKGVFEALAAGSLDYGVVPQENTIFGSVIETYDSLRSLESTFVRGETSLRIDHCLLVKTGVKLEDIRHVLSHEQALGQCREFLERYLPLASTEKTTSTAAAARALLDRPPACAAISSRVCATLFDGLEVLREAIQKEKVLRVFENAGVRTDALSIYPSGSELYTLLRPRSEQELTPTLKSEPGESKAESALYDPQQRAECCLKITVQHNGGPTIYTGGYERDKTR